MIRLAAPLALIAAVIAASRPLGWWRCDLHCDGLASFSRILGLDATLLAAGGAFALAVITLPLMRTNGNALAESLAGMLAAILAGGSCCYLLLSWHLGAVCPHCLATHAALLLAVATLWRSVAAHWWLMPLAGFAVATAIAAGRGGFDLVSEPPTVIAPERPTPQVFTARTSGPADGILVDWWIDPSCARCAEQHAACLRVLRAAGARTTLRFLVREPPERELAALCLAAASIDAATFERAVALTLGSRVGEGIDAIRPRLAESLDVEALLSLGRQHQPQIDAALAEDALLAKRHGLRRTPALVVHAGTAQRFSGDIDLNAVAAALRR